MIILDKNQNFFDPYNFNNMNSTNNDPMQIPGIDQINNPMLYYEQQYMYYRYLTQVLEYRIKMKEYEEAMNAKK